MGDFPPPSGKFQQLLDRFMGGSAGPLAASDTGDLLQMVKALIARPVAQQMTFDGLLGKTYPFSEGAADITISGATTWNDADGIKRVGHLTINANQKLTITRSPFIICVDTLEFGNTSSWICIDGPDGAAVDPALQWWMAQGGRVSQTGIANGGYGGGLLFVIARRIMGAAGKITADGGDGFVNASAAATLQQAMGGRGSLSSNQFSRSDVFAGVTTFTTLAEDQVGMDANLLGPGGNPVLGLGGVRGGSGGAQVIGNSSTGQVAGGGSGIAGGGSAKTTSGATAGTKANNAIAKPSIASLWRLYLMGCAGGGGGGAVIADSAANAAGGGGGGAAVAVTDILDVTPTMTAVGGAGAGNGVGTGGAGADGCTHLLTLA